MRSQTATAKHLIRIIQQGGDAAKQVIETLGKGSMSVMKQLFDATKDGQSMEEALSLFKIRMAALSKDVLETMYTSASKTAEYQARASKAYLEVLTKTATTGERDIIRTLQLNTRHSRELAKALISKEENWTGLELRNFITSEKDPKKVLDEIRRLGGLLTNDEHKTISSWVERAREDTGDDFELNVKGLIPETGAIKILIGSLSSPPVNLYDITQGFIADVFAAPMPGAGPSINDLFTGLMSSMSNDLSNIVRESYRVGNTTDEIAKSIRELVDEKGDSSVRRKADALARTAIAKVANATRLKTFEFNSDIVDRVMFVATLDHRTSPICILTDGTVWWNKQYGVSLPKAKTLAELKKDKANAELSLNHLRKRLNSSKRGTKENQDLRRAVMSKKRELSNIESSIDYLENLDQPISAKAEKVAPTKLKGKSIKELYRDSDQQYDKIKKLNKQLSKHEKGTFEYNVIDRELRAAEDAMGKVSAEIDKIEKVSWKESQKSAEAKTKANAAEKAAKIKAAKDEHERILSGFQEISKLDFTAVELSEIKELRDQSVKIFEVSKGQRSREHLTLVNTYTGEVGLKLAGGKDSIDIPSYLHDSFKGMAMFHNHPAVGNAIDASLSWSDFDSMYGLGQTKSVAVTNGGTIFEAKPTLSYYDRAMFRREYKSLRADVLDSVSAAIERDGFPKEYATDAYGHMLNVVMSEKGYIDYKVFRPSARFKKLLKAIQDAGVYSDNY